MKKPSILNNFKTNNWSGGTTTELFIYPPTTVYTERNFNFRLSTATVNIETSEFTGLPNVSRKIMVLDGAIELHHKQQYTKKLAQFQTDSFKGDWKTSCKGTCTDFNLMTTGNTSGNIEAITLNKNDTHIYQPITTNNWLFIYVYTGQVTLSFIDKTYLLTKGGLFVLNENISQNIQLKANKDSHLIFSTIN
jgi:environmental stress-induced protein Ves